VKRILTIRSWEVSNVCGDGDAKDKSSPKRAIGQMNKVTPYKTINKNK
jgi:hypothetical protein